MKNEEFKIGEKVKVISKHDGNKEIVGEIGTIIDVNYGCRNLDIEFDKDIDGWPDERNKWNVPFDKVVKYDNSLKVGDRVKLNKKARIEDFVKNYWNGCQLTTLGFLREKALSDEIFVVEKFNSNCVDLKNEESNEHYHCININILEKTEEVVKEMTIEEISKELGYKRKIEKIKEILYEMISCYEQEYNKNVSHFSKKYKFNQIENIKFKVQNTMEISLILKGLYIFKHEISKYIESDENKKWL